MDNENSKIREELQYLKASQQEQTQKIQQLERDKQNLMQENNAANEKISQLTVQLQNQIQASHTKSN